MNTLMKLLFAVPVMIAALAIAAGAIDKPEVPDNLKTPAGEDLVLVGHATGGQIYVCQSSEQKWAWVLKAPEADLADESGKIVVHHSAGPTWKNVDGSEVTGKVAAKHDAPKPGAIPWLLLSAASHSGQGVMTRVTSFREFIQKVA
jgi:hypothetical protein